MDDYTVKVAYRSIMSGLPSQSNQAWVRAWHKSIMSKVSCLVWKIFQNTIATKDNLVRRGVIGQGMSLCASGCGMDESISHLFFECLNFAGLWYHVCNWLGIVTTLRNEAMAHLDQFEGLIGSGRALHLRVSVIWFAGIWSIWKSRNDKLFNNKVISMDHMIKEVKRLS